MSSSSNSTPASDHHEPQKEAAQPRGHDAHSTEVVAEGKQNQEAPCKEIDIQEPRGDGKDGTALPDQNEEKASDLEERTPNGSSSEVQESRGDGKDGTALPDQNENNALKLEERTPNGSSSGNDNSSGSNNLQSGSGPSTSGQNCEGSSGMQKIGINSKSEKDLQKNADANKDSDQEVKSKKRKTDEEGASEDYVFVKERPVSISLCTSAYSLNVAGLVSYLEGLKKYHPQLIKEVKVHQLPYNDIDSYRFSKEDPVDVMILCHSINNRKFAITDVMDALYDKYLPYCAKVIGKEKMGLIVHDFDDMREAVHSSRMSSFKNYQPKAFETTSLQITCGHIEKEKQVLNQMVEEDRERLFRFLKNASKHPENMMNQMDTGTGSQKLKQGQSSSNWTPASENEPEERAVDKEVKPKRRKAEEEGAGDEEYVLVEKRPVSISLCTSAYSFNVAGLVSYLEGLKKYHPLLIKEVKVHTLPYNDLDIYRFPKEDPVDVMILCHSINNRRFAITDVMDALYDKYLPYCAKVIGKAKMGVIVHDFDDMREAVHSSRMSSFKHKQPKAFQTTSLQITCGHIENKEQVLIQMLIEDRLKLFEFLKSASNHPEIMNQLDTETGQTIKQRGIYSIRESFSTLFSFGKGSSGEQGSSMPQAEVSPPQYHSDVDTGETEPAQRTRLKTTQKPSPNTGPQSISVSVCSSAFQQNVQGLLTWLTNFKEKHPGKISDVRFRQLPYNDIDSFKFPAEDPVDVMILCHSVDNRGFSITNVMNALYEKYLKYCHDVIGKKKLAVIVHDIPALKPATVEIKMEVFKKSQKLTFELVDTVILFGRLEDSAKLFMREEDETQLICFLEKARLVTADNIKPSFFGRFLKK